jgi:hypothetical protein
MTARVDQNASKSPYVGFNSDEHIWGLSFTGKATAKAVGDLVFSVLNLGTLGILGKVFCSDKIFSYNAFRRVGESFLELRQIVPIMTGNDKKTTEFHCYIKNIRAGIEGNKYVGDDSSINSYDISCAAANLDAPIDSGAAECLEFAFGCIGHSFVCVFVCIGHVLGALLSGGD